MSVVTLSSASIRNTSVRLGEPVESEKFRQRRLRIRQWEHEQSLEDMAAIRMIQQLCDSSIVPSSSVKTEFSDLDGLSWDRSPCSSIPRPKLGNASLVPKIRISYTSPPIHQPDNRRISFLRRPTFAFHYTNPYSLQNLRSRASSQ
ncbi:hypothetical protein BXZ70DRAFT_471422 [Cristinia sonorae]|uniref:Uncharacterized protein n=1 Tax=Cristinia sonorae TaxID=1940300 RepID=A0A8K0UHE4_9AGAR|nr:hypothetical protein BXZ70DRAFT_471422 [Cristinia sonorae]